MNQKEESSSKNEFNELSEKKSVLKDDKEDEVVPIKNNIIENIYESKTDYMGEKTWEELKVRPEIISNLLEMKFELPSKIQQLAIPYINKPPYNHFVAQSKNGSGKTGAFLLGMLGRLDENEASIQCIIMAHTRELVNQIYKVLMSIVQKTKFKVCCLSKLDKKLRISDHIVIGTPVTLERQFLENSNDQLLQKVRCLVVDEADFILQKDSSTLESFDKICKFFFETAKLKVQCILFSATFSDDDFTRIKTFIPKAVLVSISKEKLTLKNVRQLYYLAEDKKAKIDFIIQYLQMNFDQERVIIFVNTRKYTVDLQDELKKLGYKVCILMGGDMDPKERDMTIEKFTKGEIHVLITTNVLSRGFDEKLVKLIINFDIPKKKNDKGVFESEKETYLHRIGRTGRFGNLGIGITLVNQKEGEMEILKDIESFYNSKIEKIDSIKTLEEEFRKVLNLKF